MTLPEDVGEGEDWKEKRKSFARFSKDKPKMTKGTKGSRSKSKKLKLPKQFLIKIKDHRFYLAMFFIIILLLAMVIVLLNIGWVINIEGDTINVEKEEELVEGVLFRTANETYTQTLGEDISKYNTTNIYLKSNTSDFRFFKDWDNLINLTIDVSFTTNISIDSNEFINEGYSLWNFQTSSWDFVKSITVTGNYSDISTYTSKNYLNKTYHANTTIHFRFQTSNDLDDFFFNLIVNISGWFSVEPTEFDAEFIQSTNSFTNFTTSSNSTSYTNYTKTAIRDYNMVGNYTNIVNYTITVDFETNITIDSLEYQNEGVSLWNYTSSSYDILDPITITGNYSNSFFYTENSYLSKTTEDNTTVKIRFLTSNSYNNYSFNLITNVSGYFGFNSEFIPSINSFTNFTTSSNSTSYTNYTKTAIRDYNMIANYTNIINYTITIDFETNITIDSLEYQNEGVSLWNYTSSSWDIIDPITITGNYSNSFFYTDDSYLSKTTEDNTTVRIRFLTSNSYNNYTFNLITSASGYFNVSQPDYYVTEFEVATQYNTVINFTTDNRYYKTNVSDFLFLKDYDNFLNFTVDISFITNISIDSNEFINEGVGLWNSTSSSWYYEPITITGNYSNSFNYTSNDYLNKTTHSNTTIRFKFQTSNEINDYSFTLIVNISAWFSVDPTIFPVEFEVAIDPPIFPVGLIDGRHYVPIYYDGYVVNGLETTRGIQTYLSWDGNYKPVSERIIRYLNRTYYDYNTNTTHIKHDIDAGRFKVEFTNFTNIITTSRFSFKQRPSEIGLYNWNTETYIQKENVKQAEEINYQNKTLTYTEIFTNTDVKFTSNGTQLKEVFINDGTTFWDYPVGWSPSDTYLTIWNKLYDFDGIDLYDDDGKINQSKVINGILKLKSTELGKELLAYLPIGEAWAMFSDDQIHYTDVKNRIVFRGGDVYYVGAIDYRFVRHAERTGKLFIDPTWIIGSDGDAWSNCKFNQTMENETTNYAHLYPNNSTGDIISPIEEAQLQWLRIQFDGNLHGESVDIYWNGSQNEIDWEMELVKENAQINTNYYFSNPSKYGSWKFVLHGTSSPFNTPEIYNVTVFNDPPDVEDFSYFKVIEIDFSKVNGSGSHINFPVLININDTDLQSNAQSDGDDIAFANSTAWLDHEIELWNGSASNNLIAWVRIPSLNTSVNTTIYMYYGNSTMGSQQNPTGVWDDGYLGTWHLIENGDGSANEYGDSTQYTNHGQGGEGDSGYVPTRVSGQIGYAQDFDDDLIDCGDSIVWNITGTQLTLQAWVQHNITNPTTMYGIMNHKGWYDGYNMAINYGGGTNIKACMEVSGDTHQLRGINDVTVNIWHFVVAVYDGSYLRLYIDGVQDSTLAKTDNIEPSSSQQDFWLGHGDLTKGVGWSGAFYGQIDEPRISNVSRNAGWIATEYNNQYDPSSFYFIGSEQTITEYDKTNISDHKWYRDWDTMLNFTVYFEFETNITITSSNYINESLAIWNFTAGAWNYDPFNYTITGNFTSNYTFTSKDYLNQTLTTKTNARIGVFTSNEVNDYLFDLFVNVSGYFQNATIYYPDAFEVGDNFQNFFNEWTSVIIYYKSNSSYHRFNQDWDTMLNFTVYFIFDTNITIDSNQFINESLGIWNFTAGAWDYNPFNYTIVGDFTSNYTFTSKDFLNQTLSSETNAKIGVFTSNEDNDYTFNLDVNVSGYFNVTYEGGYLPTLVNGNLINNNETFLSDSWDVTDYQNQNITDHKWFRDWDTMLNFTVDIDFITNITIDSNLYLNSCLHIWNFISSDWDKISNDTILGNYSNSFVYTSKNYLNQTLTTETNVKIRLRTANEGFDYSFNSFVNIAGWFQNESIYVIGSLINNNETFLSDSWDVTDYQNQNITDHRWFRDWDTMINFTVDIDFITNISIDSNLYLNSCLHIWNFISSNWDKISNDTILGNYSNSFVYTSKNYLNQTLTTETNVKIRLRTANEGFDYSFNSFVNITGWFKNETIYNPDIFEIGTNYNNNFTEWIELEYIYYDFEFHKNISYVFRFEQNWVDLIIIMVNFTITLNTTIDSLSYQNNGTRIWNVANQEWDIVQDFTLTTNSSYYFEVYPPREYVTKTSNTLTDFIIALFMSNVDYDFSYVVSIEVYAWY